MVIVYHTPTVVVLTTAYSPEVIKQVPDRLKSFSGKTIVMCVSSAWDVFCLRLILYRKVMGLW
jgi:hypothetical protein